MRSIAPRILAILVLTCFPSRLTAQETERPVTFDQAGRLATLSPSMASRLGLQPPLWPVAGDYVEARLYERSEGDFVIRVTKADGSIDRYRLTPQSRRDLAETVAQAMVTSGLTSTAERLDVISEPAGNRFVVNQVIAGLLVYAPLVASLGEGRGASLAYLLTAGGTFFAATAISQSGTVTRAQNSLATDGIWRGALLANGIRYAIEGDRNDDLGISDDDHHTTALVTLGGALAGSILGFNIARNLSDAEASGAASGSTILGVTAAGLLGATGGFQCDECRVSAAVLVGSAMGGFPLGLRYVRRAPYRVTAGDVASIMTTGMVGALASATFLPSGNNQERLASTILTGGFATGVLAGDRMIARRYDLTESQSALVRIGAFAGALIGFALPVALELEDERTILGFGSTGAIVGLMTTLHRVTRR